MDIAKRQKPPLGALYLDHVSHFVPDLDAAAAIFEKLGLAVTPASAQRTPQGPVGTSNRCIMLEEGYIEILAPRADSGLRLACFGTPHAEGELRRLADHGFQPQPLVDLRRKLGRAQIKFKVVRPAVASMPEGRIQYVQQLTPQHLWKAPYLNQLRLRELFVLAEDPVAAAARWARFSGLLPRRTKGGIRLECARGTVLIASRFPWNCAPAPALAGYALASRHPKALAARCSKAGMRVRKLGSRYVAELPAGLGGAWVIG